MKQETILEKKKKLSPEAQEELDEFMESLEDVRQGRIRRVV